MEIEIIDETGQVAKTEQEKIVDLLNYAASFLQIPANQEMSLTFVDNPTIQKVNHKYRDKDMSTDVVSLEYQPEAYDFSDFDLAEDELAELNTEINAYLGELFISVDRAKEQAEEYGHSFERELGFLAVHGFLHINGYDHMIPEDEKVMFSLQKEILDSYGLKR